MYYSCAPDEEGPQMILEEFKKFAMRGSLPDLAAGIDTSELSK